MKETPKDSSVPKRTFRSALVEMFEKDYKILGSHRVLEMIADDICQLREEFYPGRTTGLTGAWPGSPPRRRMPNPGWASVSRTTSTGGSFCRSSIKTMWTPFGGVLAAPNATR